MSSTSTSRPEGLHDAALAARLCERAGASRWGVDAARFAQALSGAIASRFPEPPGTAATAAAPRPDAAAIERFLDSLHLEDLALAVGCADGHEPAWNAFVSTHRAELRRAAIAIAGSDRAEDLSDALLGELFGVDARGGARRSLFLYFHGRSRLSTWLRAILAQRHVDRLRAERRTVALDAAERPDELLASRVQGGKAPELDPDRERLVSALRRGLDAAFAALDDQERLRLVCYHVDGMTLAEMGRLFREHEATASRKLTRIRARVRETAETFLQRECGLDAAQIRLGLEYALEQGGLDVRLFGATGEE
jgi:RNA polymerase sigma-70 factor